MRILHVMDQSLPKVIGYTIRAKYLLEAQVAQGHKVTVLTSPSQGADAVDEIINGVDYRRCYYNSLEKALLNPLTKQFLFPRPIARTLGTLLGAEGGAESWEHGAGSESYNLERSDPERNAWSPSAPLKMTNPSGFVHLEPSDPEGKHSGSECPPRKIPCNPEGGAESWEHGGQRTGGERGEERESSVVDSGSCLCTGFSRNQPPNATATLNPELETLNLDPAETHGYDIIHVHTPFTIGRVALSAARRAGIPLVYEKRNLWEESARARGKLTGRWPLYRLAKYMDTRVTRQADCVITITEALRRHTMDLGIPKDRIIVVGNGVDTDAFVPKPPAPEIAATCRQDASMVFGFIGSFFKFEGLPLLVDAFADIAKNRNDLRLVLVGDGEDMPTVKERVALSGCEDRILLTGTVPHTQVADYYASLDVLVYPRLKSVLTDMIAPLKPLEAMAMEKAVIASDVGGLIELVQHGITGQVFQAGDKQALKEALEAFCTSSDKASTMGKAARVFVCQARQWKHQAEDYNEAYAVAMRRSREPGAEGGGRRTEGGGS